jgi:cell division protein FtsW
VDLKSVIDTRRRRDPDVGLLLIVFVLAAFGIAMCYSASAVYAMQTFGDAFHFLKRQLLWFFAGIVLMLAVQEIDYRQYQNHTGFMLIISFVLLLIVLIPGLGHNAKGSARWIDLFFFKMQPSEFVKIVMVIYLVKVFSSEHGGNHVVQMLIPLFIVAVMFVMILIQPDFGTAMDLLFVSVVILFVSGFPFRYIASLAVISIPMFYLLVYQVDYRRDRLVAYFDPWKDRFGDGYHIIQSFIAFKKGGFLGVGLGFGTQKIKRLPEPHTDFIFAVIAEEMGLMGTMVMVILFCLLFIRAVQISLEAPDEFGRLLAVGLGLLITVQAFINMGVVTGVIPTTGIPLPFVSYGGSSFLSSMIAVGILLNISRYREAAQRSEAISGEVWS